MIIEKNLVIRGKHEKPILLDVSYNNNRQTKNAVIFCHGFKGYKDWGAWHLMAKYFAQHGYFFIKFNFSHNGGTTENPIDFPDLEAFGQNNFSKEMDDLESVINWVSTNDLFSSQINVNNISLIGHSRGGGIVALKSFENTTIKKAITWGGVSDFGSKFPNGDVLKQWKAEGVIHIPNQRTQQQMPLYYQFYEDFKRNEQRFNIKRAVENLNIPYLIIHGTKDETIPFHEAQNQHQWGKTSTLITINNGDHSFGSMQPWRQKELPSDLYKVIDHTISFLKK